MSKKIRLGEKKRAEIRAKFDTINVAKLGVNAKAYYNKVKAGKKRAETAFYNKEGQYSIVPQRVIQDYVVPRLRDKLGHEPSKAEIKQSLKENKTILKKIAKDDEISGFYNNSHIDRALLNSNSLTKFYIDDGNGLRKFSRDKMLEKIKKYEAKILEMGGFGFYTKFKFAEGFTKFTIYLPSLSGVSDLEELEEDDEFKVIKSDGSKKKKRKKKK